MEKFDTLASLYPDCPSGVNTLLTNNKKIESNKIGVNIFPIRSTSLDGFKLSQYTIAKNMIVYTNSTRLLERIVSGKKELTPIS